MENRKIQIPTSIIITIVTVFCSFFGFLVQIQMASKFGANQIVDAYLFSISTPLFLSGMIGMFLNYTIIPRIAIITEKEQNELIYSVMCISAVILTSLCGFSYILVYFQKMFLPSGSYILNNSRIDLLISLAWIISGVQISFYGMSAILTGLGHPVSASVLNIGPYIGMLSLMLIFENSEITVIPLGMLFGTIVSTVAILFILKDRIFNGKYKFNLSTIWSILKNGPLVVVAMSCFSAYAFIDSYWAPRAGDGVLASLGYSQRIIIALGNLAVSGPSAVLVPMFSKIIQKNELVSFKYNIRKTLYVSTFIIFLLSIFVLLFGFEFVKTFFMHGSFDENNAMQMSNLLKFFLPGMACMLLSVLLLRILFCFSNVARKSAMLGVLWMSVYFIMSSLLYKKGAEGLALAYSITWLLYLIALSFFMRHTAKLHFKSFTASSNAC